MSTQQQDTRCGTDAGYQAHRRRNEEPCAACRRARAKKIREYRASNDECLVRESLYRAARSRATSRLVALHPGQFRILMDEELGR